MYGKKMLEDLPEQLDKFEKGARARGYSDDVIAKLIEFIKGNISYSFNMAHKHKVCAVYGNIDLENSQYAENPLEPYLLSV